tara:strand:- start:5835 stop:7139 length:1305 start_codon:yes stop_codon:yes gene_type:complete
MSREDILRLCLDGLKEISLASGMAVLEIEVHAENSQQPIVGFDHRKINENRWDRFCKTHASKIPIDSIVHKVIRGFIEVDIWNQKLYIDPFSDLSTLFNVSDGGWLSAINLPQATAQHNLRGIFLWYGNYPGLEKVPAGAEQDLRFLKFFQLCYALAGLSIRNAARNIIEQRHALLTSLAPSILAHEISIRVKQFDTTLKWVRSDIEELKQNLEAEHNESGLNIISYLQKNVCGILVPHSEDLTRMSDSIMDLTKRRPMVKFNPTTEIQSAFNLVQHKAKQSGLNSLSLIAPDESIMIETDPALFLHLIVNLVVNAIESMSELKAVSSETDRSVTVQLDYKKTENLELPISIDVIDNGKGVELGQENRIFEAGVTSKEKGHGLGLLICKTIVQYLGGTIELKRRIQPTIFRLRLPIHSGGVAELEEELKAEDKQ